MTDILALIDAEIARLQQARALLAGASSPAPKKRVRPAKAAGAAKAAKAVAAKPVKKKRKLSPEGRARIAAAVKESATCPHRYFRR